MKSRETDMHANQEVQKFVEWHENICYHEQLKHLQRTIPRELL